MKRVLLSLVAVALLSLCLVQNIVNEDLIVARTLDIPEKPLLVMHVGPPKTGTSTIQWYASHHRRLLAKDNIYFLGHGSNRNMHKLWNFCVDQALKNETRCEDEWADLEQVIERHYMQNHSVFISDELFGKPRDTKVIKEQLWYPILRLQRKWNVRILFSHRRYYEWILSSYHQHHNPNPPRTNSIPEKRASKRREWPSNGGKETVPFLEYLKVHLSSNGTDMDPSTVYAMLKDNFSTVWTFNMHDVASGDLTQDFYCKMLPEAVSLCSYLQSETEHAKTKNPSSTKETHYDRLGWEAVKRGWINATLPRFDVGFAVRQFANKELNCTTMDDFPLTCPPSLHMDALLNISLAVEKTILPEFFTSEKGEAGMRDEFAQARKTSKFCSVDVEKVLEDPRWENFFKARLAHRN